jgi:hypothetical protein
MENTLAYYNTESKNAKKKFLVYTHGASTVENTDS